MLPLVGNSWRWAFVAWAVPVALIAVVIALLAPRPGLRVSPRCPRLWWPNWRDPLIWRLGLMLGSVNALYFATNTFIPYYFHAVGRDGLISPALIALNAGQVPASLRAAGRSSVNWSTRYGPTWCVGSFASRVWPASFSATRAVVIASTAVLGFAAAAVLILMLALPPLLQQAG